MIDTKNLEPFNLHFEIFSSIDKSNKLYFISEPSNLFGSNEKVNLGSWAVDYISDVLVTINDDFGFKIAYDFNTETKDLILNWSEFNNSNMTLIDSVSRLTITFYSLAYQREKTLNQLFDENIL